MANTSSRVATSITPNALEGYKHLMADTTQDLQEHLEEINDRIEFLSCGVPDDGEQGSPEWQALVAERKCAEQGLEFCAEMSSEIDRLEPTLHGGQQGVPAPVAELHVHNGVSTTKESLDKMALELRSHRDDMVERIRHKASQGPVSREAAAELVNLRAMKSSMEKSIELILTAKEGAAAAERDQERRNTFEDITQVDDSYSFTVSTVGDLVTARRFNLSGRAVNVGGQMNDEALMKAFENLGKRVTVEVESKVGDCKEDGKVRKEDGSGVQSRAVFERRHGRGVSLETSTTTGGATEESEKDKIEECESPTATGAGRRRGRQGR